MNYFLPFHYTHSDLFLPLLHSTMKRSRLALAVIPLFLLGGCLPTDTPATTDTNTASSAAMEKDPAMMKDEEENSAMMKKDEDMEKKEEVMMKKDTMMEKSKDSMMKNDEMMESSEGAMMEKEETMMKAGAYKDSTASNLSDAVLSDGTTKVLYFFAAWCPTCKKANQTLTSWYANGEGMLTVYKINFDEEKVLRQKYGVTYQHTFVKIDGKGTMIEKKQGPNDEELQALLKI